MYHFVFFVFFVFIFVVCDVMLCDVMYAHSCTRLVTCVYLIKLG